MVHFPFDKLGMSVLVRGNFLSVFRGKALVSDMLWSKGRVPHLSVAAFPVPSSEAY